MNNKKFRFTIIIMVVLTGISLGLFAVDNFILKDKEDELVQVYTASREIAPYTTLTADMFEPVSIPEGVELPGMIKSISTATDGLHYASVTVEKGTYLTESVVTQDNAEEGLIYTMEIQASYVADVAYNDVIDIFMLGKDNAISPLFTNKKLYKAKTESLASTEGATSAYEMASKMFIKATHDEMMRYYSSLRDYKLIVLPYVKEYATMDTKNSGTSSPELIPDPIQNEEVNLQPATFSYEVVEGDTYEIIAENFAVDVQILKETNANIEIKVGDEIQIPDSI